MNKAELRNVTVKFGNHTVLENFSLAIKSGKIIGIVGPSGCGKTTIVRSLCGFINPDHGTVLINDKVVFSREKHINIPPEQRKIGVVFQDYAVWPHLSVYDNIAYPLKKKGSLTKEQMNEAVTDALEQVNMLGYEHYMPAQLSGGQQQRVAIARALTTSSDFLIMDEPITNLDAKLREQMLVEIRMLEEKLGTTIIYITHDQEAAMQLCDDIVIIENDGSIAQIGTDEEIIKDPANKFVFQFIGVSNFIPTVLENGQCMLNLGEKIPFCKGVPSGYPKERKSALLGIRPMNILFDNSSTIRAKITQATFLGNLYSYFAVINGYEIRIQQIAGNDNEEFYQEGAEVGLRFVQEQFFKMEEDR